MYKLYYRDQELVEFEFIAGDPPMGCITAVLRTASESTEDIESHIRTRGKYVLNGVFELKIDEDYKIIDINKQCLAFKSGLFTFVPEVDEIAIDVVGIPSEVYENLFPDFIKQYNELHKHT